MATAAAGDVDAVRILSDEDVRRCLGIEETIDANERAFAALHAGEARVPERVGIDFPEREGVTLFKPAHVPGAGLGLKVVSVRPHNAAVGRPTVPATIVTFHEDTGAVAAVMSATYLTGLRTAAGSAVATRALMRRRKPGVPPPKSVCVFGAGLQGELHVRCLRSVCPSITTVRIINRSLPRAEAMGARLRQEEQFAGATFEMAVLADEEAVARMVGASDVIVLSTNSSTPVLRGEWMAPGTHVCGVGSYTPGMQEVDAVGVRRCAVVLDTESALAVGDIAGADLPAGQWQTLGELLASPVPGGADRGEGASAGADGEDGGGGGGGGTSGGPCGGVDCTFFKSVGTGVQDIATAGLVRRRAEALGLGVVVPL